MQSTVSKTKLTLWIRSDTKNFGKQWAKKHNESISRLFSNYLLRLRKIEESSFDATPIVTRLSGIIKNKKVTREDYKKHLEEKYLNAQVIY
jgi:hypothetical protein